MKILILGAGVYQVPAIIKAKEMGLYTIVISKNITNYPGYKIADKALECDTTDINKAIKLAKKYKIDGVFTTGTDVALPALGKINDELRLCGPSYDTALLSTNKMLMKKAFKKFNVPSAEYIEVSELSQAYTAAESIGYPVVVKAINSSGARGISVAKNKNQLLKSWEFSKKHSKPNDVILIEEFLEGYEFGAQAFVYDGKVQLACPHNDTVTPPPISTPIGHSYPFSKEIEGIMNFIDSGVRSLKIDNSAVNIDLIKTKKGMYFLEIGARMGATCLPMLTHNFTGVDVTVECIKMSIGETPSFIQTSQQPTAGLLLQASKTGVIKEMLIPPDINRDKNVAYFSLDVKVGNKVNKFTIRPDRIGEIVTYGKTAELAEKYAENYAKKIKFRVCQ